MTIILLIMYLPIAMVVLYSFNASKISAVWAGFTTSWYTKLLNNASFGDAFKNSLVLAAWSVSLSGIIGTLGAFGFTRSHFRGKGALESVALLPMMTPEIILGMAYLAIFTLIDMPLGMTALVITHTTFCVPYIFINVKSRLLSLDPSIEEAARDLGAKPVRVMIDIVLPNIMPSVLSGMLLALAMSLDDVVISFFVTGPTTNTLPLKIYASLKTGVSPEVNALCTLLLGGVFIIVGLSQLLSARANRNN